MLLLILQHGLLLGLRANREGNLGVLGRVIRGQVKADLVISGSSRAAYHYDPKVISERTGLMAYNVGRNGTKLHEQVELLRVFFARNPAPKCVIQNLDFTSLQRSEDITDAKQYLPWLMDEMVFNSLVKRKRYYLAYRLFPMVGMVREGAMDAALAGLFQVENPTAGDAKGFCAQNLTWDFSFERIQKQNKHGLRWENDAGALQLLKGMIELCRANGVELILVYSPDYAPAREFFVNREETLGLFKRVAEDSGIRFWDFSNDPMCQDRANFYNSQHMNITGAEAFSRLCGERLKSQILQSDAVSESRRRGGVDNRTARAAQ